MLQLLPKQCAESCFIVILQKYIGFLCSKHIRKKKNGTADTLVLKCCTYSSVCSSRGHTEAHWPYCKALPEQLCFC